MPEKLRNGRYYFGKSAHDESMITSDYPHALGEIYATIEYVFGIPVIANILSTTRPIVIAIIESNLHALNDNTFIKLVTELDLSNEYYE